MYKKKEYLGVSGDGDLFEIFDVSKLKEDEFLSNYYFFDMLYFVEISILFTDS